MARYTGPKLRVSRRLSTNIYENDKGRKVLERRPFPPGAHGRTRRRNAGSEYLAQLQEKQKAKYIYGVLEKQHRCIDTIDENHKYLSLLLFHIIFHFPLKVRFYYISFVKFVLEKYIVKIGKNH